MHRKNQPAEMHDDGTYVVKKSKKSNILAFILCLLIAFVIWAYTMSYGDGASMSTDSSTEQSDGT